MILSNETSKTSEVVLNMGDTLASKGLLDAAHFCYLISAFPFGYFNKKSSKVVLVGSDHT